MNSIASLVRNKPARDKEYIDFLYFWLWSSSKNFLNTKAMMYYFYLHYMFLIRARLHPRQSDAFCMVSLVFAKIF